jgi:N-acylneuraminate cytidylyltransferase
MNILGLIPARGGSKGLPRKNIRLLAGKPLIAHSIEHGLASKYVNRVIVSTDDAEIAAIAKRYGAEVPFIRPSEFATDTATDLDVFRHCLVTLWENDRYHPELVVQLRPTAPLRRVKTLDLAIELMLEHPEADSLRSISITPFTPYKMWMVSEAGQLIPVMSSPGIPDWYDQPRQKLPPVYVQNGFVDIVRPATILEKNSMAGDFILSFTHVDRVMDIDDEESLHQAEQMLAGPATRTTGDKPQPQYTIGVLQGRLTAAPEGVLQAFPAGKWEDEFVVAQETGLSHIELLAERDHNPENPIWSEKGINGLSLLASTTQVQPRVLCIDFVMSHAFYEPATVEYVLNLIERSARAGVKVIVLPLFEKSELEHAGWTQYVGPLRICADGARLQDITLCLETSLPAGRLQMFLGLVGRSDLRVCYDSGNTTALGHDCAADICTLGDLVGHVHIKDKNAAGENTLLGMGLTDFPSIFSALRKIGYTGALTLETTRGVDPVQTARSHLAFVKRQLEFVYVD